MTTSARRETIEKLRNNHFSRGYIDGIMNLETDSQDRALIRSYKIADFTDASLVRILEDCEKFLEESLPIFNEAMKVTTQPSSPLVATVWEQLGYDFAEHRLSGEGYNGYPYSETMINGVLMTEKLKDIAVKFGSFEVTVYEDDGILDYVSYEPSNTPKP